MTSIISKTEQNTNALGTYEFDNERTEYSSTPVNLSDTEKVAIFVDFDNMYKGFYESINGAHRVFIDFKEMSRLLANGRHVMTKKAYGARIPEYDLPGAFKCIIKAGFEPVIENCTHAVQKGVDVRLALELDDCSRETGCNDILLVSGDADFVPAVERAQKRGKRVQVASFSNSLSHALAEAADEVILLDKYRMLAVRMDVHEPVESISEEGDN